MIGALLDRHPRLANRIYGFTPPEKGTVVLVHRRVYIVPTQLGWLFGLTLLILLVGSINYALSLGFVRGAELDFVDNLIGAQFKLNNPNVTAACGCGTSFSV